MRIPLLRSFDLTNAVALENASRSLDQRRLEDDAVSGLVAALAALEPAVQGSVDTDSAA